MRPWHLISSRDRRPSAPNCAVQPESAGFGDRNEAFGQVKRAVFDCKAPMEGGDVTRSDTVELASRGVVVQVVRLFARWDGNADARCHAERAQSRQGFW